MNDYSDIIHLPHHQSEKHPHMSIHDRAAQFSPFAALTGYDDAIEETARLVGSRMELDEDEKRSLDESVALLRQRIKDRPEAEMEYFVPDPYKEGGEYVTIRGNVRRLDEVARTLQFTDGKMISLDDIIRITIPEKT